MKTTPAENIARAVAEGRATNYTEKAREHRAYEKRLHAAAPELLELVERMTEAATHARRITKADHLQAAALLARVRGDQ